MEKIIVIGISGAGKSVLSRKIGRKLQLPVYHLDAFFHLPGGEMLNRDAFVAQQEDMMTTDQWLIDGNYAGTLPMRLAQADTVIWLDFPSKLNTLRVIKRSWQFSQDKSTRPDMPDFFEEQMFDKAYWQFLKFVWTFNKKVRPYIVSALENRPKTARLIILKNRRQVTEFMAKL